MTKGTNTGTAAVGRQDQLRKLLRRKNGATIAQIQSAYGWQAHSARAAISNLRRAGELIDRQPASKGSVYRIVVAELERVDER
ncbi:DUF3489 domain-containing protein [Yoonia sp. SDW83-1]|uniref:DUF3489 domain-containing protein n=1 Tax=Yoonia sp. SDW83-1 TaxID=3366945 RepID=UPI00398C544E